MITRLAHVTILVRDQDEALRWYTEKLGLEKRADEKFGPGARWLTVAPKNQKGLEIVLQMPEPALHGEARAKPMMERIGQGTTWVFQTEDCRKEAEILKSRGVKFLRDPQQVPRGMQAIFEDLYANTLVLLGPR